MALFHDIATRCGCAYCRDADCQIPHTPLATGEEIRLGGHDLLIEDEAFINWAATDMAHCAPFREWFRAHAGLFYPPRWHGRRMEYVVLDLHCSEHVRVQRILRRRLARNDPARAVRQTRRNGLRSETLVTAREAAAIVRAQPPTVRIGVTSADVRVPTKWGHREVTRAVRRRT